MESSITVDGVTVHGSLADMTAAYESVRAAINTGTSGSFALDTTDGAATIRQIFLINANTRLSARLVYTDADPLPERQPTP